MRTHSSKLGAHRPTEHHGHACARAACPRSGTDRGSRRRSSSLLLPRVGWALCDCNCTTEREVFRHEDLIRVHVLFDHSAAASLLVQSHRRRVVPLTSRYTLGCPHSRHISLTADANPARSWRFRSPGRGSPVPGTIAPPSRAGRRTVRSRRESAARQRMPVSRRRIAGGGREAWWWSAAEPFCEQQVAKR